MGGPKPAAAGRSSRPRRDPPTWSSRPRGHQQQQQRQGREAGCRGPYGSRLRCGSGGAHGRRVWVTSPRAAGSVRRPLGPRAVGARPPLGAPGLSSHCAPRSGRRGGQGGGVASRRSPGRTPGRGEGPRLLVPATQARSSDNPRLSTAATSEITTAGKTSVQ